MTGTGRYLLPVAPLRKRWSRDVARRQDAGGKLAGDAAAESPLELGLRSANVSEFRRYISAVW